MAEERCRATHRMGNVYMCDRVRAGFPVAHTMATSAPGERAPLETRICQYCVGPWKAAEAARFRGSVLIQAPTEPPAVAPQRQDKPVSSPAAVAEQKEEILLGEPNENLPAPDETTTVVVMPSPVVEPVKVDEVGELIPEVIVPEVTPESEKDDFDDEEAPVEAQEPPKRGRGRPVKVTP